MRPRYSPNWSPTHSMSSASLLAQVCRPALLQVQDFLGCFSSYCPLTSRAAWLCTHTRCPRSTSPSPAQLALHCPPPTHTHCHILGSCLQSPNSILGQKVASSGSSHKGQLGHARVGPPCRGLFLSEAELQTRSGSQMQAVWQDISSQQTAPRGVQLSLQFKSTLQGKLRAA